MENINRQDLVDAILTLHELKSGGLISKKMSDVLFECVCIAMDAQKESTEEEKNEPVRYENGKEPDCNKCGDYERCAFDREHCTGFIPGTEAVANKIVKVPMIKMVPKEGAHVIPNDDRFSRGDFKPSV